PRRSPNRQGWPPRAPGNSNSAASPPLGPATLDPPPGGFDCGTQEAIPITHGPVPARLPRTHAGAIPRAGYFGVSASEGPHTLPRISASLKNKKHESSRHTLWCEAVRSPVGRLLTTWRLLGSFLRHVPDAPAQTSFPPLRPAASASGVLRE